MGAFGDARSRLKLVPCQHPDLSRKQDQYVSGNVVRRCVGFLFDSL